MRVRMRARLVATVTTRERRRAGAVAARNGGEVMASTCCGRMAELMRVVMVTLLCS